MFDIGFFELCIIFIIGLLVLGPERLPNAIRSVSLWLGRLRQAATRIKKDIEQEVGAEDIRQQLHNESIMQELGESKEEIQRLQKEFQELSKPTIENNDSTK